MRTFPITDVFLFTLSVAILVTDLIPFLRIHHLTLGPLPFSFPWADLFFVSNNVTAIGSYERTETFNADGSIDVSVTLPPFRWGTPHGLDDATSALFWQQPENHRHFKDSLVSVSGVVQIVSNATLSGSFIGICNQTHYLNYANQVWKNCDDPDVDALMYISCHEVEYFQHFLDNGVPHISLMQFAAALDPSRVTFLMDSWTTDAIPSLLRRYGFKDVRLQQDQICAEKLILPKIVPVLHPLLTRNFIDRLKLNHSNSNQVILVSRNSSDDTNMMRLVTNQAHLERLLRNRYGKALHVFRHSGAHITQTIELFEKAVMVIGSHGGAMYNALWAGRSAKVVELIPISTNGAYPGQESLSSMPPFAHLAIYTNSFMNGQPFYRWFQISNNINFHVDIEPFANWLSLVESGMQT
jgi:hypothetical protein